MLVGRPKSLVIYERMETVPFPLHGKWEGELEDTLLGSSSSCEGRGVRLSR